MVSIAAWTKAEGPVDLSAATIYAYFRGHAYDDATERTIADAYVKHTGRAGLRTSGVVGQSATETGRHTYGNQVLPAQWNFCGLGATDDGARGLFIPDPETGVKAHIAHWGNYLYGPFANWPERMREYQPFAYRNKLVLDLMKGRRISTFGELGSGVWGTDSPYYPKVLAHANALLAAEATRKGQGMKYQTVDKLLPSGVNHWDGRNGHPIEGMVVHVAEGYAPSTDSWFHNPGAQASSQMLVLKDGTRWRFVRDDDTAWANGVVNKPNMGDAFIANWVGKNINPNRRTLSVETERMHTERLTAQQIESLGELAVQWHTAYGWPTDGSRVWAHSEFDSVNRPGCPSLTDAEWDAAIRRPISGLASLAKIDYAPPAVTNNDSSVTYDLTTGYYIDPAFYDYYSKAGGWTYFGRPIAGSCGYSDGALRQAFENCTLELPKGGAVKLASIGTAYQIATGQIYPTWPTVQPRV